jgi:hypothetical protein
MDSQSFKNRLGKFDGRGVALLAAVGAICLLAACSIDANDHKNGDAHVDIKSPVGDLHVSEQVDIRDSGLSIYPGAKPAPKDDSDDKKSANVNLSMPGFSLKVVAAEFMTDDAPDKVIAYYNKELPKFGKPIQCHGHWDSGGSAHADFDSKKGDDLDKPVSCDSDSSSEAIEIKVGTEGNQHLVSVKPSGKGSRFALVYVRIHAGSSHDTI